MSSTQVYLASRLLDIDHAELTFTELALAVAFLLPLHNHGLSGMQIHLYFTLLTEVERRITSGAAPARVALAPADVARLTPEEAAEQLVIHIDAGEETCLIDALIAVAAVSTDTVVEIIVEHRRGPPTRPFVARALQYSEQFARE